MKETGILIDTTTSDLNVEVQRDATGKITQGLVLGNVTNQNISAILRINPGELKEKPLVGVGINKMILDHDFLLYKHKIRQQLADEGMKVSYLEVTNSNIDINASYN